MASNGNHSSGNSEAHSGQQIAERLGINSPDLDRLLGAFGGAKLEPIAGVVFLSKDVVYGRRRRPAVRKTNEDRLSRCRVGSRSGAGFAGRIEKLWVFPSSLFPPLTLIDLSVCFSLFLGSVLALFRRGRKLGGPGAGGRCAEVKTNAYCWSTVPLETVAERRDMGNLERAEKGEKKSRRSTPSSNTTERKEAESETARTFKRQMGKEARSARRFGDFFSNKACPSPKATKMDQGQCRIPTGDGGVLPNADKTAAITHIKQKGGEICGVTAAILGAEMARWLQSSLDGGDSLSIWVSVRKATPEELWDYSNVGTATCLDMLVGNYLLILREALSRSVHVQSCAVTIRVDPNAADFPLRGTDAAHEMHLPYVAAMPRPRDLIAIKRPNRAEIEQNEKFVYVAEPATTVPAPSQKHHSSLLMRNGRPSALPLLPEAWSHKLRLSQPAKFKWRSPRLELRLRHVARAAVALINWVGKECIDHAAARCRPSVYQRNRDGHCLIHFPRAVIIPVILPFVRMAVGLNAALYVSSMHSTRHTLLGRLAVRQAAK
ncbi:hypothetical protein CCUS01_05821 [Colletotrichum cuscutae]|uniref:Uncharacterized protein n=1 Tax=Colletotrichum cuscutae TaxID=1209917 RepID=A0AAI9Y5C1_9PEZI|nr:hypothetical protein CCUS01_05821 [Colletotrichum cuscutae]